MKQDLCKRFLQFAISILRFLKSVPHSIENNVIIHQLAKSSTSIGANYEESQGASSKADFYHKIKISLRESRETLYWLKILHELNQGDQDKLKLIIAEATEINKILGSISSKQKKKKENVPLP